MAQRKRTWAQSTDRNTGNTEGQLVAQAGNWDQGERVEKDETDPQLWLELRVSLNGWALCWLLFNNHNLAFITYAMSQSKHHRRSDISLNAQNKLEVRQAPHLFP